tara:strand:- start:204 stop:428 length:225 start_codon:yes stop_codon:yes gene_type:complete
MLLFSGIFLMFQKWYQNIFENKVRVGKDGAYIMEVYDFVLLVNLYNTHLGAAQDSTTPTNATPGLEQNLYKLRM